MTFWFPSRRRLPDCLTSNGFAGYSLTPTFNLAPLNVISSPTNPTNGKLEGLEGEIASINSAQRSFSLSVPEGPDGTRTLFVSSGTATIFQGITNFSALSSGMFVNMDAALQPDGSLAATRIAVEDPSAINMLTGPPLFVASEVPVLTLYGRQEQGPLAPGPGGTLYYFSTPYLNFSDADFQVSGQLTNLQNLPFVPSFNARNMVAGQNVDVSSAAFVFIGGEYTPARTITLIPRTINATVIGSSSAGNFTDYTVALAPYDLFPTLAVQAGRNFSRWCRASTLSA